MSAPAIKRISREYQQLVKLPSPYFIAAPVNGNLFEWHFTLRGPRDSEFQGGKYHGKLLLPSDYPFSPPDFIFLTPNGRYATGSKICLSITRYHVETWQPTWSIRKMIEAVAVFMVTPTEGAVGALDYSPEIRKQLAAASIDWRCPQCKASNEELIPGEEDPEMVKIDAERNNAESASERAASSASAAAVSPSSLSSIPLPPPPSSLSSSSTTPKPTESSGAMSDLVDSTSNNNSTLSAANTAPPALLQATTPITQPQLVAQSITPSGILSTPSSSLLDLHSAIIPQSSTTLTTTASIHQSSATAGTLQPTPPSPMFSEALLSAFNTPSRKSQTTMPKQQQQQQHTQPQSVLDSFGDLVYLPTHLAPTATTATTATTTTSLTTTQNHTNPTTSSFVSRNPQPQLHSQFNTPQASFATAKTGGGAGESMRSLETSLSFASATATQFSLDESAFGCDPAPLDVQSRIGIKQQPVIRPPQSPEDQMDAFLSAFPSTQHSQSLAHNLYFMRPQCSMPTIITGQAKMLPIDHVAGTPQPDELIATYTHITSPCSMDTPHSLYNNNNSRGDYNTQDGDDGDGPLTPISTLPYLPTHSQLETLLTDSLTQSLNKYNALRHHQLTRHYFDPQSLLQAPPHTHQQNYGNAHSPTHNKPQPPGKTIGLFNPTNQGVLESDIVKGALMSGQALLWFNLLCLIKLQLALPKSSPSLLSTHHSFHASHDIIRNKNDMVLKYINFLRLSSTLVRDDDSGELIGAKSYLKRVYTKLMTSLPQQYDDVDQNDDLVGDESTFQSDGDLPDALPLSILFSPANRAGGVENSDDASSDDDDAGDLALLHLNPSQLDFLNDDNDDLSLSDETPDEADEPSAQSKTVRMGRGHGQDNLGTDSSQTDQDHLCTLMNQLSTEDITLTSLDQLTYPSHYYQQLRQFSAGVKQLSQQPVDEAALRFNSNLLRVEEYHKSRKQQRKLQRRQYNPTTTASSPASVATPLEKTPVLSINPAQPIQPYLKSCLAYLGLLHLKHRLTLTQRARYEHTNPNSNTPTPGLAMIGLSTQSCHHGASDAEVGENGSEVYSDHSDSEHDDETALTTRVQQHPLRLAPLLHAHDITTSLPIALELPTPIPIDGAPDPGSLFGDDGDDDEPTPSQFEPKSVHDHPQQHPTPLFPTQFIIHSNKPNAPTPPSSSLLIATHPITTQRRSDNVNFFANLKRAALLSSLVSSTSPGHRLEGGLSASSWFRKLKKQYRPGFINRFRNDEGLSSQSSPGSRRFALALQRKIGTHYKEQLQYEAKLQQRLRRSDAVMNSIKHPPATRRWYEVVITFLGLVIFQVFLFKLCMDLCFPD